MSSQPKVAIIVLNYNSWQDTAKCVSLCLRQDYPDFLVIVVDNGSSDGSIEKLEEAWRAGIAIKYWAQYAKGEAETGGTEEKERELDKYGAGEKLVLIRNDRNLGYSAGNNVGIRYALKKEADAVLIVNPDVLLEDKDVLAKMGGLLFRDDNYFVVGPRVYDSMGRDQNPMYEPSFIEEVFGTLWKGLTANFGWDRKGFVDCAKENGTRVVEKVSGCCMMIKSSFLRQDGLFDENTFLYSEEPILAYRVRAAGGRIVYMPDAHVRHIHCSTRLGIRQYREFITSRIYFLKKYKEYGLLKLFMVRMGYGMVLMVKLVRSLWRGSACRT
jgi:GT2 family glycosyltransferase